MNKFKQTHAITLIALIITIIVLLILAGVVINMTLGKNGIIQKSQVATETYKISQVKEELELLLVDVKAEIISNEKRSINVKDCNRLKDTAGVTEIEYISEEIASAIIKNEDLPNAKYAWITFKGYKFKVDNNLNIIQSQLEQSDDEDIVIEPTGMISDTKYKINNTTLEFNKIVVVGKNEEIKTLKAAFDYLCDNNYKENVAIVLKEGTYTTQDIQTGNSENIDTKYNRMDISIIADTPGKVFLSPGETGMTENGSNYGITLKFYRIVFKSANGNFHMNMDKEVKEYYNCVINTSYGGWNGNVSDTSMKTENCLFMSSPNEFYSENPTTGTKTNNASVNQYMYPYNGTKTTCLYNVSVDNYYNITSNGWKNTGTGTNPDGTQANIGVYGGEFAWPYIDFNKEVDLENSKLNITFSNIVKQVKYLTGDMTTQKVLNDGTKLKINKNKVIINNIEIGKTYTVVFTTAYGETITRQIYISGMMSDTRYKINNTILEFNKIVIVGKDEQIKTVKGAFDYLCNNNYKENVAIVLKEGTYDTADIHTGSSYNINTKYSGMSVSIIADCPGNTFLTGYEMGMIENGNEYWIELKFYRVIFIETETSNTNDGVFHLELEDHLNEYYNCVFNSPVGGYSWKGNNTIVNTYNCLFTKGANEYYSSVGLYGIAKNCASKDTTIDPYNGTKTTCLTNVAVDHDYNIISEGWEHTGTGTNPDGTQANIGVYGGAFAWPEKHKGENRLIPIMDSTCKNGSSASKNGVTVSVSDCYEDWGAQTYFAVDGKEEDYTGDMNGHDVYGWMTSNGSLGSHWFKIEFSNPVRVTSYYLRGALCFGGTRYDFKLQASNKNSDNLNDWVDLENSVHQGVDNGSNVYTAGTWDVTINNTNSYKYYRIYFTQGGWNWGTSGGKAINELVLYGI